MIWQPEKNLIQILWTVIHMAVRALAIWMTIVVLWGVADVVMVLYQRLTTPPFIMLTISDILGLFGAFIAVLIVIETLINDYYRLCEMGSM